VLPFIVITGASVSRTVTVLVFEIAALPAASLTLYITVYAPAVVVSTVLVATMFADISPSKLSVAVALASV
jgi:hypothetical protein